MTTTEQRDSGTIAAANNAGITSKGRGRPCASLACATCRSRKIKCDVQTLTPGEDCTPCRSSNTQCVVNRYDDRRRGRARDNISRIQGRLDRLEARFSKDDLCLNELPSIRFDHEAASDAIVTGYRPIAPAPNTVDPIQPASKQHDNTPAVRTWGDGLHHRDRPQADEEGNQHRPVTPPASLDLNTTSHGEECSGLGSNSSVDSNLGRQRSLFADQPLRDTQITANLQQAIDTHGPVHPESDTFSAAVDEGSEIPSTEETVSCLNFDQVAGQPRYYGAASRLYIHECVHTFLPSADPGLDSTLDIDLDSLQIQKQLLFLFWHVQTLPAVVVDENLFRAGRAAGGRSQYYSNFLQNALLACASRASTSSTLRGLGERYIKRAKAEVSEEIERPNLASLQGYLLLSDFEATQGRDRVGWIYCGTACRLLFDLGLHEDCSNLVQQARLTVEDACMRRNSFLNTFIFEKLWSLYLGRPSSVNEVSLRAVRNSTRDMKADPAVDAYVSLCIQVSAVTELVNSPACSTTDLKARVIQLDGLIQSCYHQLPAYLKNQEHGNAEMDIAAYGINMQFCGIRIVLHRKLSRVEGDRFGRASSRVHNDLNPTLANSNSIIHDNAVQIGRLIRDYKQIYGVDRMATIMLDNMYIAAQVLISDTIWQENRNLSHLPDLHWIRVLADTMKDVEVHYPVTARMRSTLARLAENTSLRGLFGSRFERRSEEPIPPLPNDFGLSSGAWGTDESFFNFDLADSAGYVSIDAIFSGN